MRHKILKTFCIMLLSSFSLSACSDIDERTALLILAGAGAAYLATSANNCNPGGIVVLPGGGTGLALGNC
jgi:hypothetical protein